jgi:hypothetical protein
MNECVVIWVGNDGLVEMHERLYLVPKGKVVGEVLLILPDGEILHKDGDGEEFEIDPVGDPAFPVAIQIALVRRASLTITAPVGFGLDRFVKPLKRAMKGYRPQRHQDWADPITSAPDDVQELYRAVCEGHTLQ